jgi:exonuclease SbcC
MDWMEHLKSWLTNYFTPLMKTIEYQVLQQIYADFSQKFAQWFNMLIEDEEITVSIDEQFTPKVTQNGYDLDIDAMSGGERTSVALAYRLTLNKIVNDLIGLETKDLLILDEPTEGFSTEQLDRVRDVLDIINIAQLIVVSHEPKMDGFVDSVMRVEKTGSTSKVEQI